MKIALEGAVSFRSEDPLEPGTFFEMTFGVGPEQVALTRDHTAFVFYPISEGALSDPEGALTGQTAPVPASELVDYAFKYIMVRVVVVRVALTDPHFGQYAITCAPEPAEQDVTFFVYEEIPTQED